MERCFHFFNSAKMNNKLDWDIIYLYVILQIRLLLKWGRNWLILGRQFRFQEAYKKTAKRWVTRLPLAEDVAHRLPYIRSVFLRRVSWVVKRRICKTVHSSHPRKCSIWSALLNGCVNQRVRLGPLIVSEWQVCYRLEDRGSLRTLNCICWFLIRGLILFERFVFDHSGRKY